MTSFLKILASDGLILNFFLGGGAQGEAESSLGRGPLTPRGTASASRLLTCTEIPEILSCPKMKPFAPKLRQNCDLCTVQ